MGKIALYCSLCLILASFPVFTIIDGSEEVVETTFSGYVKDSETSEPIRGAKLSFTLSLDRGGYVTTAEADLDGFYTVNVKRGGEYEITCSHKYYQGQKCNSSIRLLEDKTVDFMLDCVIEANSKVYGQVMDSRDGRLIPDANVHFYWLSANLSESLGEDYRTDEDGYFEFFAGEGYFQIDCFHWDYQSNNTPNYLYYILEEDQEIRFDIYLDPYPNGVCGKVVDESGGPISRVMVKVGSGKYYESHYTNSEGEYDIRLQPGEYELNFIHDEYRPHKEEIRVEYDNIKELDVILEKSKIPPTVNGILLFILQILGVF